MRRAAPKGERERCQQKSRQGPFGFRLGGDGELVPDEAEQEAIREMVALRAQGKPLRAIADAVRRKRASRSATRAWRGS